MLPVSGLMFVTKKKTKKKLEEREFECPQLNKTEGPLTSV